MEMGTTMETPPKLKGHSFFKIMLGDFSKEMRIPRSFKKHFNGHSLGQSITITSSNGDFWTVKLEKDGNNLCFRDGWEDLVNDLYLQKCNFLVFNRNGESEFDIAVYNKDGCEVTQWNAEKLTQETGRNLQTPPRELSFVRVIVEDFSKEMLIPYAFIKNFRGNLLRESILRSPTGASWTVQVEEDRDNTFFRGGWKKFVKDQSLGTNDFLVFRYSGDLQFDFKVYDENGCEKNIVLPSMNSVDPRPNAKKVSQNRGKPTTYDGSSSRDKRETGGHVMSERKHSVVDEAADEVGDSFLASGYSIFVTTFEERKKYSLTIPSAVATKRGLRKEKSTSIVLCNPTGKSWNVFTCVNVNGRVSLARGWFNFCEENNIAIDDTLIFEFISDRLIHVHINGKRAGA